MKEIVVRERTWVRSENVWLTGVCQGMGERFGIDPNVVRLIWVFSILLFGTGLFLYILLSMVLPREDRLREYDREKFLGVCYRLSRKTGIDLGLIRLLSVISLIASFGTTSLLYFILFFLVDEQPPQKNIFHY